MVQLPHTSRLYLKSKVFKAVIFLLFGITLSVITAQTAHAATRTWDGGGADNNWSTCANWSTDICPISTDDIVFNGTSSKNASVDAGFAGTVGNFNINAGYTGTVSLARSLSTAYFTQSAGTFNSSNQTLTVYNFIINSGTFTAPSSTLFFTGGGYPATFTINPAATFNHNNGTIEVTQNVNMSCGNKTFNLVRFTASAPSLTINSDCNLPVGNNPSIGNLTGYVYIVLYGTLTGSGTLNVYTNGPGYTQYGTLVLSSTNPFVGFSNLNLPSLNIWGGNFTAPSGGTVRLANLTVDPSTNFNANGATFAFFGSVSNTSIFRIQCGGKDLHHVTLNYEVLGVLEVNNECNLPLGSNPNITVGEVNSAQPRLQLSGQLSGSDNLTMNGYLQMQPTASITGFSSLIINGTYYNNGATDNYGTLNSIDINGNLTIASSGTFVSTPQNLTVSGLINIADGATFNANNGTVVLDGIDQAISGNITFYNLTKTVSSTDSLGFGLGQNVLVQGKLTLLGANGQPLSLYGSSNFTHFANQLIGQPDFSTVNWGNASDQNLDYPLGVAIDTVHHRLFVADSDNIRVLIYLLDSNNNLISPIADYVLGQPNFTSSNWARSDKDMGYPNGLAYDPIHDRLFVSDSDNSRIMVFETSTISNYMAASYFIGQIDANSGVCATTQAGLCYPAGIAIDTLHNILYVADGSSRVMVYDLSGLSTGMLASYVIGQDNFTASDWATSQTRFKRESGVAVDAVNNKLYVVDGWYANRVLVFDTTALANGMPASYVIGQTDFTTEDPGTTRNTFSQPVAAAIDNGVLAVMDSYNGRIMFFDGTNLANGMNASNLIGPWNFTTSSFGFATQSDFYMCGDEVNLAFAEGKIWMPDSCNERILGFDVSAWFTPSLQWGISATNYAIQYVSVANSNNFGGTIGIYDSVDGGNNTNWQFLSYPNPTPNTPVNIKTTSAFVPDTADNSFITPQMGDIQGSVTTKLIYNLDKPAPQLPVWFIPSIVFTSVSLFSLLTLLLFFFFARV